MNIYKKLFLESFKTTINNWRWWWLGFFAVLFTNSIEISLFNNFFSSNNNIFNTINSIISGAWLWPLALFKANTVDWLIVTKMILFALILLGFSALVVLLAIFAQLILISKTNSFNQNKTKLQSNKLADLWQELKQHFAPALIINLAVKVFVFLLCVLIALPLVFKAGLSLITANIIYLILFILLISVAVTASMVFKLSVVAMVTKNYPWRQAVAESWQIFKVNWLSTIEISLSLFLLTIISSFLVILLIAAISIPIELSMVMVSQLYKPFYLIFKALEFLLAFGLFFVGIAFMGCYNTVTWTNFYLFLDKNNQKTNFFGRIRNQK